MHLYSIPYFLNLDNKTIPLPKIGKEEWFTIIHLKPYTREEFIEIAVNVLNRDEGIEKDVAKFIAELVFDNMISNMRECIRIARLGDNNIAKTQRVVNMLTTYGNR